MGNRQKTTADIRAISDEVLSQGDLYQRRKTVDADDAFQEALRAQHPDRFTISSTAGTDSPRSLSRPATFVASASASYSADWG